MEPFAALEKTIRNFVRATDISVALIEECSIPSEQRTRKFSLKINEERH